MLKLYGQTDSADEAFWTAWACVLAPDAVADWTIPLHLAEKARAESGKDKINHVGAVLYRAGRFEDALQRLTEANAEVNDSPDLPTTVVYNWLFQAMAHQRLGHTEEAATWLKKAVQVIDDPESYRLRRSQTWHRKLTLQLLRREAEELLKKE
jgi:tetratricopeptide (TPR) repeat protein